MKLCDVQLHLKVTVCVCLKVQNNPACWGVETHTHTHALPCVRVIPVGVNTDEDDRLGHKPKSIPEAVVCLRWWGEEGSDSLQLRTERSPSECQRLKWTESHITTTTTKTSGEGYRWMTVRNTYSQTKSINVQGVMVSTLKRLIVEIKQTVFILWRTSVQHSCRPVCLPAAPRRWKTEVLLI